jgi:hypothetical protein
MASSFILSHGGLLENVMDDLSTACKTTRGGELQKMTLLSEIPGNRSHAGDDSCHQSHDARRRSPKPHQSQPMSSNNLLPDAILDQ